MRATGVPAAPPSMIKIYEGDTRNVLHPNFPVPFTLNGEPFLSALHAYEACRLQKAPTITQQRLRAVRNVEQVMDLSKYDDPADWSKRREAAMAQAVEARFAIGGLPELLATAPSQLVYYSLDPYWGCQRGDGTCGANVYGRMLARLRDAKLASVRVAPAATATEMPTAVTRTSSAGASVTAPPVYIDVSHLPAHVFSNSYMAPIMVDAHFYMSVEHYFQSVKFFSYPDLARRVREAENAEQLFHLVDANRDKVRTDWKTVREGTMLNALRAKFTQHAALANSLQATGDAPIYICSPSDRYWALDAGGHGENKLGALLMKVRQELVSPASAASAAGAVDAAGAVGAQIATHSTVAPSGPPLLFYHSTDPFFEFTNFFPACITMSGKVYPTSEHYFQCQKFHLHPAIYEQVRNAPSPRAAFDLSRTYASYIRADWQDIKDGEMLNALRAKFTQHPKLGALLLSTGSREIVEHTANDKYWADGGDGSGQNKLGKLLMQVRDELRTGKL